MNFVATLLPVSKLNNALKQSSVSLMKSHIHRNSNSLLFISKGHRHIFTPIKVAHETVSVLKHTGAHIISCKYLLMFTFKTLPVYFYSLIDMYLSSYKRSLRIHFCSHLSKFLVKKYIITGMTLCTSKWINPSNASFLSSWWKAPLRTVQGELGWSIQGAELIKKT